MTSERMDHPHRGLLSFRMRKSDERVIFASGSEDEKDLLRALRKACEDTFGSSDRGLLTQASGGHEVKGDYFARMAMGRLLGNFPRVKSGRGRAPER